MRGSNCGCAVPVQQTGNYVRVNPVRMGDAPAPVPASSMALVGGGLVLYAVYVLARGSSRR